MDAASSDSCLDQSKRLRRFLSFAVGLLVTEFPNAEFIMPNGIIRSLSNPNSNFNHSP
jgi:hypothetical protein